jgi:hypothetical protein
MTLFSNFRYFIQLPLGIFSCADGGCAAIDAIHCVNPVAKPLFITGAIANIVAGVCMLGSFGLGYICVPAAVTVGGAGTALRRVGLYAVTSANSMELTNGG